MKYTLLQLILLAVTFAFWNAYVILWGTSVSKKIPRAIKYSKIWHLLGWIVRLQMAIIIAYTLWDNWILILKWELLFLCVSNILYDLIINIVRYSESGYPHIFYVDNKGINKILLKIFRSEVVFWIVKGLFLIGSVIFILL